MSFKKQFGILVVFIALITISLSYCQTNQESDPYWHSSVVYQVYPRSFKDSDGDGVGDLQGIRSKLSYFVELGVEIVWLSPIFESPMADFGYDVSNYTNIEPIFGTLEDFDQLVTDLHSKGLKILLDFVPNHTSNLHEWFIRSSQNDPEYKNYYVWADPKGYDEDGHPIPPNNWLSAFRYSAWTWVEEREQFYYHGYLKEMPDLNYRNPMVIDEIKNSLRFWLDRGVDGFRIDVPYRLFEVEDIYNMDEPINPNSGTDDPTQFKYLLHIYTQNQPENYEVLREWREDVLDTYPSPKIMLTEQYSENITLTMLYYGNTSHPIADFPFNFNIIHDIGSRNDLTGINLKSEIDQWMNNLPKGKLPTFLTGSHDENRVASRYGSDVVDAMNMFILLLPGTPVTYYGEELGMEDTLIRYEDGQDPNGCNQGPERYAKKTRDFNRTPMQWDTSKFAGFTEGNTTWLPVNKNYKTVNVATENAVGRSSLMVYKKLTRLRKKTTFTKGSVNCLLGTKSLLAFTRELKNEPTYLIIINTSTKEEVVNLENSKTKLPAAASVVLRSSEDERDKTKLGVKVTLSELTLLRGEGIVLKLEE